MSQTQRPDFYQDGKLRLQYPPPMSDQPYELSLMTSLRIHKGILLVMTPGSRFSLSSAEGGSLFAFWIQKQPNEQLFMYSSSTTTIDSLIDIDIIRHPIVSPGVDVPSKPSRIFR
jgi:hypothetical protein